MALPAILAGVGSALLFGLVSFAAFGPGFGDLITRTMYEFFQSRILTGTELTRSFLKEAITEERYRELMRENGFSDDQQDLMIKSVQEHISIREMLILWFRYSDNPANEFGVNREWLEQRMKQAGQSPETVDEVIEANRPVPDLNDIIRFATRDVFEPEQAKLAGLFEGMPELFVTEAKKRGLDPIDTQRFWAAHWFIPSTHQMIEMSQRLFDHPNPDVRFGEQEMLQGFKLADIAPGFRERLLAISKQPIGRVDIRRFDRLGIFGEGEERRAQLIRRYLELGYKRADAEIQTEFTIQLNDRREIGGSEAEVLRFYREGVLTEKARERALEMLKERGVPENRAKLLLELEDLKQITDEERKEIERIKSEFLSGTIENEGALRAALVNVPMTSSDVDRFTKEFKKDKEALSKRMSNSQADRLRRLKIITEEEWREIYRANGMQAGDVERISQSFAFDAGSDSRVPSKDDVIGWYEGAFIEPVQFLDEMTALGYTKEHIILYAEQAGRPLTEDLIGE